jgi:DNA-binding helix-hairpin-helix protein with protein kinase domain
VSDSALVTVLDTDSFQFRDPQTGNLHLCRVRTDGFIAPEVYATGRNNIERTVEQDLFGLAVLIFHLLMEGIHPFAGRYQGPGDPPPLQQNVIAGNFPYNPSCTTLSPMPTAPPFTMLSATLRALFLRCFIDGHSTPTARPTAKEWQKALHQAAKQLVSCTKSPHHFFDKDLDGCPWCTRVEMGLADSFPVLRPERDREGDGGTEPQLPQAAGRSWIKALGWASLLVGGASLFVWILSQLGR